MAKVVYEIDKKLNAAIAKTEKFNDNEKLFENKETDYKGISNAVAEFKPFKDMWTTTDLWYANHEKWLNCSHADLDGLEVEKEVDN